MSIATSAEPIWSFLDHVPSFSGKLCMRSTSCLASNLRSSKEPGTLEERKLLARQLVERMQSFPENEGTWSKKLQIGSADVAIDITRQDRDGSLIISINGNSDIGSIGPSFHIRDWDVTGEVSFAPLSMQGTKFEFEVTKEKQDPRHLDLARRLYKGILEAILAQF